jgi:hypothetical protein
MTRGARLGVMTALLVLVLLALSLLFPGAPFCQDNTPEDYQKEEFPQVLHDLRRGEIILAGTFPLTLFVALEAFDFYRFAANDWAREYAPWPVRSPNSPDYEPSEKAWILVSALSLSAVLAIADYLVGEIRERRSQRSPSPGP